MESKKISLKTLIVVVAIALLTELILISVLYYEFVAIPAQRAAAEMTLKVQKVEQLFESANERIEKFQGEFNAYKTTVDTDMTSFKKDVVNQLDYLGFIKRNKK